MYQFRVESVERLVESKTQCILEELKSYGIGQIYLRDVSKLLESSSKYRQERLSQMMNEFKTDRREDKSSIRKLQRRFSLTESEAERLIYQFEHFKFEFRILHHPDACLGPPHPIDPSEMGELLAYREVLTQPISPSDLEAFDKNRGKMMLEESRRRMEEIKSGTIHSNIGSAHNFKSKSSRSKGIVKKEIFNEYLNMVEEQLEKEILSRIL